MKVRQGPKTRGIALLIVMIVIIAFGLLAGLFASAMRVEIRLARNAARDSDMEWIGRSGVELAKFVLAQQTGQSAAFDALNQRWAGGTGATGGLGGPDGIGESFDILSAIDLENYELETGKSFGIRITDLDRKFNINGADEIILRQALTLIGVDSGSFPLIVDSILDWRDLDDSTHLSGTESDFYQGLTPPYLAKNGPIDDLTELLAIRGISPAMYWGSRISLQTQMLPREASRSSFDEPIYAVGLADLFTALSGPTLNLNTASATALQVIPTIDENMASRIVQTRNGGDGIEGTDDDMPFRSPNDLMRAGVPPEATQQFARMLGVKSLVFEVEVLARIDNYTRRYYAVLRRNSPQDIQILSFSWK